MENEQSLRVIFTKEKETANTVRFQEVEEGSSGTVVGRLYMQKKALKQIGNPQMIIVQITSMEDT